MKKLVITALLVLAQFAVAAPPGEVKRMTREQARERVERSTTYKDVVKAREAGKDIASDPRLLERVTGMIDLAIKDVVTINSTEVAKLVNVSSRDVLSEVLRLASIAKDRASSPQEVQMAKKSLELIAKASNTVEMLAVNEAGAQIQRDKVTKIIEISDKISSLNFGASSKSFVEKYEKALAEGKSVEEAIKIASNGKFTEKELRECE